MPALPPTLPPIWSSPFAPELPLPPAGAAPAGPRAGRVAPVRLWLALSHPLRWRLVLRMAAGEELTAPMAARGTKIALGTVRTHLGALKKVGVIASRPGLDRRSEVFFLPPERRPEPGVLDFGSCRILLAEGAEAG